MIEEGKWRERLKWHSIKPDLSTILYLLKSGLAPTIALCLLINDDIAAYLGPVGYITGILAINPVLPLGQHLELMLQQFISICFVSAVTLLELFCVIKARTNTAPEADAGLPPQPTPSGAPPPPVPYNSSAAAVAGVWLVVLVFCVSFLRSARPALMMPCINFTVVVVVTSSIAPTLPNMSAAEDFAARLLVINVIGIALAYVVGLINWPSTNTGAFLHDVRDSVNRIEECLAVRMTMLGDSLDWIEPGNTAAGTRGQDGLQNLQLATKELSISAAALLKVWASMHANLYCARREPGIRHLDCADLDQIHALLSDVVKPLLGLVSSMDYASGLSLGPNVEHHRRAIATAKAQAARAHAVLLEALHLAFRSLRLERTHKDAKKLSADGNPADSALESLRQALRGLRVQSEVDASSWQPALAGPDDDGVKSSLFCLTLQSGELTLAACSAAIRFAEFAQRKVRDGTMSKRRLVVPHLSFCRVLRSIARSKTAGASSGNKPTKPASPSMLPSRRNSWRKYAYILQSPHASFALRIACAVLCSQIPAYLRQTQQWYNEQRVVWTSITIAVVTHRGLGQSVVGVLCQIIGTLSGCLLSLLAWYIVDRKLPGVMVFYLLGMMLGAYPAYKRPELRPLTMGIMITLTLLVGYELESERIGEAAVTAMGQPYYPPYLLSWRNLLAILAGVGIAFFWTLFPYPSLESRELPIQIGDAMFSLAAFHLRTHMAVYACLSGLETSDDRGSKDPSVPTVVETETIQHLTNTRTLLNQSKYEIRLGGQFPKATYAALLDKLESLFRSIALVSYSTKLFAAANEQQPASAWMRELRRCATPQEEIELQFVSVLAASGTAIVHGQPLPPFLHVPETSSLLDAIKASPMDLLDTRHSHEAGYIALAAIYASAMVAAEDIRELLRLTAELVGQVDFRQRNFYGENMG